MTKLPSGVEKRIAELAAALSKRFRVAPTGIHGLAIVSALWDAYKLGLLMRDDDNDCPVCAVVRPEQVPVHMAHCYRGEHRDGCKYGYVNCPARSNGERDE